MTRPATEHQSVNAMSGAGGQKTLTSADTGYTYEGLISGYECDTAGNTISGDQYNQENNSELESYTDKPLKDDEIFHPLWVMNSTWTITGGEVTIYFG